MLLGTLVAVGRWWIAQFALICKYVYLFILSHVYHCSYYHMFIIGSYYHMFIIVHIITCLSLFILSYYVYQFSCYHMFIIVILLLYWYYVVNMFVLSYPERGSIESIKSYKSYKSFWYTSSAMYTLADTFCI